MHDHEHGKNNHGRHHHHHHDEAPAHGTEEMPVSEKLEKMVAHWLRHNADHASTYRQWAQRAREAGMEEVAAILEKVAEDSQSINADLEKAGRLLGQKD